MKLSRLRIHNFRGIIDQELAFDEYTLLVGPNNSGKTMVIDSLRAFYEKEGFKFRRDNDFPYIGYTDQESWLELTFHLTQEEHESLADDYRTESMDLRVRKFLQTGTRTHDSKSATGLIFGYRGDGTLSNEPFYGAKNVQSGKFGDVIYIPAISRVDEHAKLSGPSALRDLLTGILGDVVEGGQAYADLKASIKVFAKSVCTEKSSDGRCLADFEAELSDLLSEWEAQFRFAFAAPSAPEIIRSMLDWHLVDDALGREQPVDNYGSGFQRHFIYSLIQLGARYATNRTSRKSKDFVPSLKLVLFEEPEAFLHPPQQEVLARNLMRATEQGDWQVVCATHSAHFVSKNAAQIPAIVRLRRSQGKVAVFQVRDAEWSSIVEANLAINRIAKKYPGMSKNLHEDDTKPEMEAVKHFLWLNPDRSSVFFANHVLLVEGPSEVALINKLVGDCRIRNAECGLYVMDCLGKYNIHRFMNLLGALGVAHSVLYDDDHQDNEHADLRQLIEDSRHPSLTLRVQAIPGKLESFLELPAPKSPHRKPQHVLYLYETGQIKADRLERFCELVASCLPCPSSTQTALEGVGTI